METPVLIAFLVVVVVAFFGWQWWSGSQRRRSAPTSRNLKGPAPVATSVTAEKPLAPAVATNPMEEKYPEVVGQTETDLRTKEPLQQQPPAGAPRPQPVTASGMGPADVEDNLRHPEQAFHQPVPVRRGGSDVPAGRAATVSMPGFGSSDGPTAVPPMVGNQQAFAPEMAQNGGAFIGESVFAFDGMEPVGFSAF
jgi:hypothetical protein